MTFLGIDLGTTFVKGAVLDLDTLQLGHIQRVPFPAAQSKLPEKHYEISADAVVSAFEQAVQALLPHAGDCQGIILSTQMHSVLLVDQQGQLLTQAITWLDQRVLEAQPQGGSYFEQMSNLLGPQIREELGNELRPGLPIGTLYWLCQQADAERLHNAIPLTMADYVLMRLAGAKPGVDPTNAAATGALNVRTGAWHHEALARLGLDRLEWPAIEPLEQIAGYYQINGRAIPCYRAVGDAQCSLIGGGLAEGELSINIATGSQVSMLRAQPGTNGIQTRPFFDQHFLTTLVGLPAGRALNLLVSLLTELGNTNGQPIENPWDYLQQAAAAAPDSDLSLNLAFFGAGPHQGSISNINEANFNAGSLFRAAYRQMAENYYQATLRLAPDQDWQGLVLTGGIARQTPLLREFIAQRFGSEYRLGPAEDALTGLLTLALVCAGKANSVADAAVQVQQAVQ